MKMNFIYIVLWQVVLISMIWSMEPLHTYHFASGIQEKNNPKTIKQQISAYQTTTRNIIMDMIQITKHALQNRGDENAEGYKDIKDIIDFAQEKFSSEVIQRNIIIKNIEHDCMYKNAIDWEQYLMCAFCGLSIAHAEEDPKKLMLIIHPKFIDTYATKNKSFFMIAIIKKIFDFKNSLLSHSQNTISDYSVKTLNSWYATIAWTHAIASFLNICEKEKYPLSKFESFLVKDFLDKNKNYSLQSFSTLYFKQDWSVLYELNDLLTQVETNNMSFFTFINTLKHRFSESISHYKLNPKDNWEFYSVLVQLKTMHTLIPEIISYLYSQINYINTIRHIYEISRISNFLTQCELILDKEKSFMQNYAINLLRKIPIHTNKTNILVRTI